MSSLEIILIIIGIVVIVISCRLADNSKKDRGRMVGKPLSSLLEENIAEADKKRLMDKMNELLSEATEETIARTDDALSRISNEKIMAVNEFSDQILEKIKRNHEEVVFLYNMLNDKEKELKAAVREIDASKKKMQDIMERKAENDRMQAAKNQKGQADGRIVDQAQAVNLVKTNSWPAKGLQEPSTADGYGFGNNSRILSLSSEGRSVLEISKLLGLGQGEVKLVIDLFRGRK